MSIKLDKHFGRKVACLFDRPQPEAYLEHRQTSMMELFAKIVKG